MGSTMKRKETSGHLLKKGQLSAFYLLFYCNTSVEHFATCILLITVEGTEGLYFLICDYLKLSSCHMHSDMFSEDCSLCYVCIPNVHHASYLFKFLK